MQIYKDTFPGFDSKSKVEAAIQNARNEWERRSNGENFPFQSPSWAMEIVRSGTTYEYIGKSEGEANQAEAEEQAATARAEMLVKANTDPKTRDQVIFSRLNEAGYTPEKVLFAKIAEDKDGKDMSAFWAGRSSAKQNIVDEINSAS